VWVSVEGQRHVTSIKSAEDWVCSRDQASAHFTGHGDEAGPERRALGVDPEATLELGVGARAGVEAIFQEGGVEGRRIEADGEGAARGRLCRDQKRSEGAFTL
jgi:hypothetical protein